MENSYNTTYEVRSTSLPTTSHPSTHKIEKELNDIKTRVFSSSCNKPSMEAICDGLLKLSRLYERMPNLVNSFFTAQKEKLWVEDLIEGLVGFLDVCGIIRDIVSQVKEHVRDLQCALRRRKGDPTIQTSIARYNCFKKKVKKDVKGLIASLKKSIVAKSNVVHHHHHDDELVIKMVLEMTASVFESILKLFVMPNSQTPRKKKWCMKNMLIQRKRVACEEHHQNQQINDFESLHLVVLNRCRLETMEAQIERINDSLECIFRSLIRTRASLLNVVSNF